MNSQVFTFVTGLSLQTSFFELYKDIHVHNAFPILVLTILLPVARKPIARRVSGSWYRLQLQGEIGWNFAGAQENGSQPCKDPDLYLKGQKGQVGSKIALKGKGGSSTGGYVAQGTGVSNSGTLGRTSGESSSYGSGETAIGSEGTITGKKGKPTDSKKTAIGSGETITGSKSTPSKHLNKLLRKPPWYSSCGLAISFGLKA